MNFTRVAAIVVNYQSSEFLVALLASLENERIAKIMIWDNFSSEDERARVGSIADRFGARTVFDTGNRGFGPAVNASVNALAPENYDFYWVLNPDTVVRSGALDVLLATAKEQDLALLSPLVLASGSEKIWYAGGSVDLHAGRTIHAGIGRALDSNAPKFQEVTFVSGAAILVRADSWRHLGGFDEAFFLYCEDADLSIRAAGLGYRLGVVRDAVVEHAEGGSSNDGNGPGPAFYYYVQRNRLILYSQFTSAWNLLVGAGLGETLRLLILPWRPLDGGAFRRFVASLRGLRAGLQGERGQGS